MVEQPDVEGREEVLMLHARDKPVDERVDFAYLVAQAGQESGFRTNAQASTSSARGHELT